MGMFDKIFGKKDVDKPTAAAQPQEASEHEEKALGLIVVFDKANAYTRDTLKVPVRSISPLLKSAAVQVMARTYEQGTPVSRITWADHVVDIVGFDLPLPPALVEDCVASAYYPQAVKAAVRANKAHALLYYGGTNTDTLEQYVALSAVAAAMSKVGAVGVLNESAMLSLPANVMYELAAADPNLDQLRHMPLLMLYCGFVKYFMKDNRVWMRTYNCPRFGLPDLAMLRSDTGKSQATFDLFSSLLSYLLSSGKRFAPGHTAQFGELALRFRAPRDDEPFPTHTAGVLLIVEMTNSTM